MAVPQQLPPVSGHIFEVPRKKGSQLYAKWRDHRGHHQRRLGPLWQGKGRAPAGYLTRRQARAQLEAILVRAREDAQFHPVLRLSFAAVAADWVAHGEHERALKPTTLMEYRSVLRCHLLPVFGEREIDTITTRQIETWRSAEVRAGRSRRSVNKCLTILHGILGWAVRHRDLPTNPAANVERLPDRYDPGDYDFYSVEQVLALVRAAATRQDGILYLTAAFTGLRRGEVVALRWRDVDFPAEAIRVMNSYAKGSLTTPKSNRSRVVPMVPQVAQALAGVWQRGYRVGEEDLVFLGEEGGFLDASALRRRFLTACEIAGLPRLRFHDLRHTFGSLAINKASLVQVQHWLGHADIETTARYLHHKRRADEARLLADAFAPETGGNAPAPTGEASADLR